MERTVLKTVEFKLYLSKTQERTLTEWLRVACWTYNRCLEQRIKAYKRRKESVGYNAQCALLTGWRKRMPRQSAVHVEFLRDSLRRVDRGFKSFFRRIREGNGKPGFPRFRPHQRYNSMECLQPEREGKNPRYIGDDRIRIPGIGRVRARGRFNVTGEQRLLRIIRRASGWYAQVLIDTGEVIPEKVTPRTLVGIDVGLESFATLDTGEKIANPRFLRQTERELKAAQRKVSRCQRGSNNRRKAVKRLARQHERVRAQRRDFAHQQSRRLVNRFDLLAFEKLNVKGLARMRLAKSVHDAAWSMFTGMLLYKAANAGKHAIPVDPRGTSMECPECGAVKRKELSERVHACSCGCILDRDTAAARVILSRALGVAGACGGQDRCIAPVGDVSRPDETGSLKHWHSRMLW